MLQDQGSSDGLKCKYEINIDRCRRRMARYEAGLAATHALRTVMELLCLQDWPSVREALNFKKGRAFENHKLISA